MEAPGANASVRALARTELRILRRFEVFVTLCNITIFAESAAETKSLLEANPNEYRKRFIGW